MDRLRDRYRKEGMRQSVEGILLVHEHNHPHVILFQHGTKDKPTFRLIGGRLRPGEDEITGLIRKLDSSLSPLGTSLVLKWQIGECIGMFWRPNFEEHLYPYLPAHITRPKEAKRLFMVHLPDRAYFAVPKNLNLKAIPLFELYSNQALYGSLLAALPQMKPARASAYRGPARDGDFEAASCVSRHQSYSTAQYPSTVMAAGDLLQFNLPCITTLYDIDFSSTEQSHQLQLGPEPSAQELNLRPVVHAPPSPPAAVPSSPLVQSLYNTAQQRVLESLSSDLTPDSEPSTQQTDAHLGAGLQARQHCDQIVAASDLYSQQPFRAESHSLSTSGPSPLPAAGPQSSSANDAHSFHGMDAMLPPQHSLTPAIRSLAAPASPERSSTVSASVCPARLQAPSAGAAAGPDNATCASGEVMPERECNSFEPSTMQQPAEQQKQNAARHIACKGNVPELEAGGSQSGCSAPADTIVRPEFEGSGSMLQSHPELPLEAQQQLHAAPQVCPTTAAWQCSDASTIASMSAKVGAHEPCPTKLQSHAHATHTAASQPAKMRNSASLNLKLTREQLQRVVVATNLPGSIVEAADQALNGVLQGASLAKPLSPSNSDSFVVAAMQAMLKAAKKRNGRSERARAATHAASQSSRRLGPAAQTRQRQQQQQQQQLAEAACVTSEQPAAVRASPMSALQAGGIVPESLEPSMARQTPQDSSCPEPNVKYQPSHDLSHDLSPTAAGSARGLANEDEVSQQQLHVLVNGQMQPHLHPCTKAKQPQDLSQEAPGGSPVASKLNISTAVPGLAGQQRIAHMKCMSNPEEHPLYKAGCCSAPAAASASDPGHQGSNSQINCLLQPEACNVELSRSSNEVGQQEAQEWENMATSTLSSLDQETCPMASINSKINLPRISQQPSQSGAAEPHDTLMLPADQLAKSGSCTPGCTVAEVALNAPFAGADASSDDLAPGAHLEQQQPEQAQTTLKAVPEELSSPVPVSKGKDGVAALQPDSCGTCAPPSTSCATSCQTSSEDHDDIPLHESVVHATREPPQAPAEEVRPSSESVASLNQEHPQVNAAYSAAGALAQPMPHRTSTFSLGWLRSYFKTFQTSEPAASPAPRLESVPARAERHAVAEADDAPPSTGSQISTSATPGWETVPSLSIQQVASSSHSYSNDTSPTSQFSFEAWDRLSDILNENCSEDDQPDVPDSLWAESSTQEDEDVQPSPPHGPSPA
ncbi:hypothetical protein WJX74_004253 [Apatococcus lobatus]|uniref:Cleavage and polyadenylation specificity factor subunit 5 n=1 Tax=Apatococcus lobatus TaxID=904363 RepID=A0AAW1RLB0_9CHLO